MREIKEEPQPIKYEPVPFPEGAESAQAPGDEALPDLAAEDENNRRLSGYYRMTRTRAEEPEQRYTNLRLLQFGMGKNLVVELDLADKGELRKEDVLQIQNIAEIITDDLELISSTEESLRQLTNIVKTSLGSHKRRALTDPDSLAAKITVSIENTTTHLSAAVEAADAEIFSQLDDAKRFGLISVRKRAPGKDIVASIDHLLGYRRIQQKKMQAEGRELVS